MRIVEFDPSHCKDVRVHPSQLDYQHIFDDPPIIHDAYSAFDGDELIAVGGVMIIDSMPSGWVLFTDRIRPVHFVSIHRTLRRIVRMFVKKGDPVLAHVDPDDPNAIRWAKLLGLEVRGTDVLPNGQKMLRMESCS